MAELQRWRQNEPGTRCLDARALAVVRDGGAWEYLLPDALGNVRQLADASGNLVQSYTYAPFGELLAAQGTRSSALRYTGEQTDVDTGLVYLRARWYDSATGRFTTRDPFPGFADVHALDRLWWTTIQCRESIRINRFNVARVEPLRLQS